MLQNKLTEVKGRLLEMMFEMYRDMNTDSVRGVDYETFYEELIPVLVAIRSINTIGNLEEFCEEWGMNDEVSNPMSFPSLVNEAYKDSIKTKP